MCTPPAGSSSNTTAASRIGNCIGASSGIKLPRQRRHCPSPLTSPVRTRRGVAGVGTLPFSPSLCGRRCRQADEGRPCAYRLL
ncbi:hypothetical protein EOA27_11225 [Mesorhizobium sp. M2A.F.Ca.ET.037.01.1.1]|nr:hypothetical protein EOA27_11225 [Mesorhizobium sp. M2A.F.Ca.ET.037.01.1.1]